MIVAQVRAVAEDIGVDAVKIGMLGTAETVDAVVEALGLVGEAPVVVDPVMVAESGAVLLDDDAREALVERLLPLATVVDPQHPRGAGADRGGGGGLPGGAGARGAGARPAGGGRHRRPQRARSSTSSSTAARRSTIDGRAPPGGASHGSGCTHSSALAARLALGDTPLEAARAARADRLRRRSAPACASIGAGAGPGRRLRRSAVGPRSVDFAR